MTATTMTPPQPRGPRPAAVPLHRRLAQLALVVLALWLGYEAWVRNIDQACHLNEWPYLRLCAERAPKTDEELAEQLLARLARNPGDSASAVALAVIADRQPDKQIAGVTADEALARAQAMAPQDQYVLHLQANKAIREQRWADALQPLIKLSQFHRSDAAAEQIARLIHYATQDVTLQAALAQAAQADSRWLNRPIRRMPRLNIPVIVAMPTVSAAMIKGRLSPSLGRFLIQRLKTEGHWLDAHAVWQHLWQRPLALLFNGDFEQPFLPGGFDWEPGQRNVHSAGAQVARMGWRDRSQVMQVRFTGRPMAANIVRQDLVLPHGAYQLSGEYYASELRSEKGLVWTVICARTKQELARTEPMVAEGRSWRPLSLTFQIPAECGIGATLSLRPQAAFEAKAGMRGEILFDRMKIERKVVTDD
jgi:hypothetical protein